MPPCVTSAPEWGKGAFVCPQRDLPSPETRHDAQRDGGLGVAAGARCEQGRQVGGGAQQEQLAGGRALGKRLHGHEAVFLHEVAYLLDEQGGAAGEVVHDQALRAHSAQAGGSVARSSV